MIDLVDRDNAPTPPLVFRLPDRDSAEHLNFPERVRSETVARLLGRLEAVLANIDIADVVLNFEKTHWFDLLPLAQIIAIIVAAENRNATLHVVGPATGTLPYMHEYAAKLRADLPSVTEEHELKRRLEAINRHESERPRLRQRAGAFLRTWAFFDALEDHYEHCRWYAVRDKAISLRALKDHYGFIYGHADSDRIRALTVVQRDAQALAVNLLNSEELIAGALKKYAGLDIFRSGAATNVLFFEPFENVFQHAFEPQRPQDAAVFAMRMIRAKAPLERQSVSPLLSRFMEKHDQEDVMEIVVADAGRGIVSTLGGTLSERKDERLPWHVLRHAFEASSTRKIPTPPGKRGLAWLKEHLIDTGGLVTLRSDSVAYEVTLLDNKVVENTPSDRASDAGDERTTEPHAPGVGVQILLPLAQSADSAGEPERYVRWLRRTPQSDFFPAEREPLRVFRVPEALLGDVGSDAWTHYLSTIDSAGTAIVAFDLAQQHATRTALEVWFAELLRYEELRGRCIILNCNRHNAARLPTITALDGYRSSHTILPLCTPTLRIVFVGANEPEEHALLQLINGQTIDWADIADVVAENPYLFAWHSSRPTAFRFDADTMERAMRESLGEELAQTLARDDKLHYGRTTLPFEPSLATTLAVEPHQLFADQDLARRLCEHIALLVRRRYAPSLRGAPEARTSTSRGLTDIAILTATRIGREFAIRMPEAFPRSGFIFFDHHMIRPDKPRLVKPLIKQRFAVIVVDLISTGDQVRQLIRACSLAGTRVLAVVSLCDFSEGTIAASKTFEQADRSIDHLTFWRAPQTLSPAEAEDGVMDPETLTLKRATGREHDDGSGLAELSTAEGLRYLDASNSILAGHFELFGRHFDYAADVGRLISDSSPVRGDVLRACEKALLQGSGVPVAIVLYPDLSGTHRLLAQLQNQPRIQQRIRNGKLLIMEGRRGARARGRKLWLTDREIKDARDWAHAQYGDDYAVAAIEEIASSGQTLLALMELARELRPSELVSYVVVNRMTHVQTQHHREIERFRWARSSFHSLLDLNVQGYGVETCPLCRERRELARDAKESNETWFRDAIQVRYQRLDVRTSVEQQTTDPELRATTDTALTFSWETGVLPGERRTALSYIVSARVAINDGVPVKEVISEVENHPYFIVWRETMREIARRNEVLQAQRAEEYVADYLLRMMRSHTYSARRSAALELIRSMRAEAVLPRLRDIIAAALRNILDNEMQPELALLIKRFLDYRHGSESDKFERTVAIDQLLEQHARSAAGSTRGAALELLQAEFRARLVQPEKHLTKIIRQLETYLRTGRGPHHQFVKLIKQYVADRDFAVSAGVRTAIDTSVVVTYMGRKLVETLSAHNLLKDQKLLEDAGYNAALELRDLVRARQRSQTQPLRDIQDQLDAVSSYLSRLHVEVAPQLADIPTVLDEEVDMLRKKLKDNNIRYELSVRLPDDTFIAIVDNTILSQVLQHLTSNIFRHAVDRNGQLRATLEVREDPEDEGAIQLVVACDTREPPESQQRRSGDPSSGVDNRVFQLYGAKRKIDPRCVEDAEVPWREMWTFRRM
jgi:two-component sensor histidine kinase/hypoxanthine-guanine phosphoribosyltransferase